MPVCGALKRLPGSEDGRLAEAWPNDLDPDGKRAVVEPTGDRQRWNAGQVEYPAEVVWRERLEERPIRRHPGCCPGARWHDQDIHCLEHVRERCGEPLARLLSSDVV